MRSWIATAVVVPRVGGGKSWAIERPPLGASPM
jgi:hypothetical protein